MKIETSSINATRMLWLTVLLLILPLEGTGGANVLSFGVVPQQSATRLAELWTPICEFLGQKTGNRFIFKTAKDIPTFEERLAAGDYDIAYMNPYHYTVFSEVPGYRAFAKESGRYIQGLIVVGKNSPLQKIEDLDGRIVAFPAPAAFAASVLPQAYLARKGILIHPRYVNSHDSVYLTVSRGIYPAGGGIERTFNNMPEEIRAQLRILWKSPEYTPHAFAAHPRVPPEIVAQTASVLVNMAGDSVGRELLKNLNIQSIGPAQDKDWDSVRDLGIDILKVPAAVEPSKK